MKIEDATGMITCPLYGCGTVGIILTAGAGKRDATCV